MVKSFLFTPDSSRNSSSSSILQKTPSERVVINDFFFRLDADSKVKVQECLERLKVYRQRDRYDPITNEEEDSFIDLLKALRDNYTEMKNISSDISTLQMSKILSSRIVDQVKTSNLIVDGLHATLRQLQMEFQQVLHTKRKQDLLSLSRSPFEEDSRSRRRTRGVADLSAGITDSLLHSRQILIDTVAQSSGALGVLAQSSGSVNTNLAELRDQTGIVGYAKKLLGKYGRREWTDKILICLALIFFFSVVFYITHKRIF